MGGGQRPPLRSGKSMEEGRFRKPNRLSNFDYSRAGAYFLTICTKDRRCILSQIDEGAAYGRLNSVTVTEAGHAVERELKRIGDIYDNVHVDSYVIMPNHVHIILMIQDEDSQQGTSPTISRVVQQLKGTVTKKIGKAIWQKGFYDHVIRDEQDYLVRRKYIEENPVKWAMDEYHTERGRV